jgi:uncharacterized circularly permuted ATP-grasp superfamily protein/uncharacterized alpha-E superfamily protein
MDNKPAPVANTELTKNWTEFFNHLGTDGFNDLSRRNDNLKRQIRDNGVTYNVYADANGPQRPWSLNLFPLIVPAQEWATIEAGVKQRTQLLNNVMADVYGPQTLLARGLLPAALVLGHPGYLRAMQGIQPPGGMFLHIAAFDLARGPDGRWWVISQRTQAPSGLGYLLENRISVSRQFPEAFREMRVQRLAESYKSLVSNMRELSPGGDQSRIVLLTPGPYNETYFEHAYLARYLGLTLVEGSDLMVRDEKLYLKTLKGLEPVHGLLKRLDDEFLDPLELRADSTLGVPGLLQAIRAGNVLVANAPGSAFLESSAILGFLPALSRHLLGQTLSLPSLATWWCGEQAVMQGMLAQLKNCVIKPTYPGTGMTSVIGHTLSLNALADWTGRITRQGEDYTVQSYLPLSQNPAWHSDRISPRSAVLRVFAVADGSGGWQVLPGGLARLAGKSENIASMQRGGTSADVWALSALKVDSASSQTQATQQKTASASASIQATARPADPLIYKDTPNVDSHTSPTKLSFTPAKPLHTETQKRPVTSRAAENLYWLGRYTERAENSLRLAQITLKSLSGEDQSSQPLLAWLSEMAVNNGLVNEKVPPATEALRVFERSLIAALADTEKSVSVGRNLGAIKSTAASVRERLSQEQWHVIVRAEKDFLAICTNFQKTTKDGPNTLEYSCVEALRALETASGFLAAMTGAQTDRMVRDDGWRMLSIGRHIERFATLSSALACGFRTSAVFDDGGFNAMLALFDSTITFHAQFQQRRDLPALVDLLVLDRNNPRSLSWVMQTLKGRLAKLEASTPNDLAELLTGLPDPTVWNVENLLTLHEAPNFPPSGTHERLIASLTNHQDSVFALSERISRRYFSHASSTNYSVGT